MAGQHPGSISAWIERLLGQNDTRSFRLDVQLANDTADVVILDAKKGGEIGAARYGRVQPLGEKLRLDLRCLGCRCEPGGELGDRLLGRFRRCDNSQKSA
jgi:hypothetical protein